MKVLTDAGDPRVTGDGGTFDRAPFSDPEPVKKKGAAKRKTVPSGTRAPEQGS